MIICTEFLFALLGHFCVSVSALSLCAVVLRLMCLSLGLCVVLLPVLFWCAMVLVRCIKYYFLCFPPSWFLLSHHLCVSDTQFSCVHHWFDGPSFWVMLSDTGSVSAPVKYELWVNYAMLAHCCDVSSDGMSPLRWMTTEESEERAGGALISGQLWTTGAIQT